MVAEIFFWLLAAIALWAFCDLCRQYLEALGLFGYLRSEARRIAAADKNQVLPKAAVVLSLRGPDPRLPDTLHALLAQDYPDFIIQVVVDSDQDPVLNDVNMIQQESVRIRVLTLRNPGNNCSLKCSSLIQAAHDLEEDVELVAFIDGDVVPHAGWLKDLALPIVNNQADVTGGNRWYLPPDTAWGSLVRYFWNAGFMREMWAQATPWAGTMALKRTTIFKIGLLEAWSTAMSVDATLHRCLNAHGQRFKLVGSLLMTNRETIGIAEFHRWVTRQMAVIRYTAPRTVRSVHLHVISLLALHLLVPAVAATAMAFGHAETAGLLLLTLLGYWIGLGTGAAVQEFMIQKTLRLRGEDSRWVTPAKVVLWYPAIILTHFVIVYGVLKALRVKTVNWRGISYHLLSNGGVKMENYHPFGVEWSRTDNRSVI